jgi:hypothetical protein
VTRACVTALVCLLPLLGCKKEETPDDIEQTGQACDSDGDCPGAQTCCDGRCANTALSSSNCQACGTSCSAAQYCAASGCSALTFDALCANATARKIYDGNTTDQQAADQVATAFVAACAPQSVSVSSMQQSAGTASNGGPNGGRGVTYIVAGGGVYQDIAEYLNTEGFSPVKVTSDGFNFQIKRLNGQAIVTDNFAAIDPAHGGYENKDYFVIHAAYDDASGTLVLSVYGIYPMGTTVGAWYFANVLATSSSAFNQRWLVVEWQDGNSDGNPQAGEFTVMGSE